MDQKIIKVLNRNKEQTPEIVGWYFTEYQSVSSEEYEIERVEKRGYSPAIEITHFVIEVDQEFLKVKTFFRDEKRKEYTFDRTRDLKTSTETITFAVEGFEIGMQENVIIRFL